MLSSRLRLLGYTLLGGIYLLVALGDLIAPYDHREQVRNEPLAPVSTIRFRSPDGAFSLRPYVYGNRLENALTQTYSVDETRSAPLGLFVRGSEFALLGLIPTSVHLFGTIDASTEGPRVHLLGTDALGRDRFSRLLRAMRFSLLVAPIGALLATLIGLIVGLVSGYSRWLVDTALMGVADTVLSLPSLILILAVRVAFPLELPPMTAAALLIMIFAFFGWAEIARLTRGLVRSTRQKEFILAAKATGTRPLAILYRHILPNIIGPVLAQALLILPLFLLSEAALSFLGVGLQEPEASLGNMLAGAADLGQLGRQPLLLLTPGFVIFVYVLAARLCAEGRARPA